MKVMSDESFYRCKIVFLAQTDTYTGDVFSFGRHRVK